MPSIYYNKKMNYPDWHKHVDDQIVLHMNIVSSFVWYCSNTTNPVSQAEFTFYRIKEHCEENRQGWSKKAWREFITSMISTLWACELIDELNLND